MKKLCLKLTLFTCLLYAINLLASTWLEHTCKKRELGYYQFLQYVNNKPDIVIFGASRAQYHYVSPIIAKNTKCTAYNFGIINTSILAQYTQLLEILKIYEPKLIVFEVSGFDFSQGYMSGNLDYLRSFPSNAMLDKAKSESDEFFILGKLMTLYKFNKVGLYILLDRNRYVKKDDANLGYHSLDIVHLPDILKNNDLEDPFPRSFYNRNNTLAETFSQTLDLISKERLNVVFFQSPYFQQNLIKYPPVNHGTFDVIKESGLPYYDFRNLPGLDSLEADCFYDLVHMTGPASRVYTEAIIPIIEKHIHGKE